jgi:hypothetical protein
VEIVDFDIEKFTTSERKMKFDLLMSYIIEFGIDALIELIEKYGDANRVAKAKKITAQK